MRLSGRSPVYLAALAHAYGIAGRRSQANRILDELGNLSRQKYVSSYDLAIASLGIGEPDKALELLAKAIDERCPRAAFLRVDPRFDALRNDARFKNLLIRIGSPLSISARQRSDSYPD